MRIKLKLLRIKRNLTQEEMAEKIGVDRSTYAAIEKGVRGGRQLFWEKLQKALEIPESEMWELTKNEK